MHKKLKKGREGFQVVDGPLAGRKFKPGIAYTEDQLEGMADADLAKFEKVKKAKAVTAKAVKGGQS